MPRRRLSDDERRLWSRVVAEATPLRCEEPETAPTVLETRPPEPSRPGSTVIPSSRPSPGRVSFDLTPDPHDALALARPDMDRRRFDKLRRGRLEPEARLDLHGMTAERAHRALTAFVLTAYASGLRLALVITGKGRPGEADAIAPHRHGVLRHSVPHWLAAPPLVSKVLQVTPAHARHGGAGAYYVYLRRQR